MKVNITSLLILFHLALAALYIGFAATYQFTEKERFNATPDFFAYFTAGTLAAEHVSPYNETAFKNVQYALIKERTVIENPASVLGFLNPPHMALLFAPLAPLGYQGAFLAWFFVNILCSLLLMRDTAKYVGNVTAEQGYFLSRAMIGLMPWSVTLVQGQISIVLAWALLRFFMALEEKNFLKAACWTIFFSLKPHLFFLMAFPLALGGYARVILWSIMIGIAVAAVTSVYFGFSIWNDYIQFLQSLSLQGEAYGAATHFMVNLRGMISMLGGDVTTGWSISMYGAAAVMLFSVCVYYRHACSEVRWVLLAIAVLGGGLFGPWLHEHDTYILFPVVLMLLKCSGDPRHIKIMTIVYGCILVATVLHPLQQWLTFTGVGELAHTLMLLKKSLIFSAEVILLYGAGMILYKKSNAS